MHPKQIPVPNILQLATREQGWQIYFTSSEAQSPNTAETKIMLIFIHCGSITLGWQESRASDSNNGTS